MPKKELRQFDKLLKDIGFNPERPLSTQHAFLKHLIKAADELRQQNAEVATHAEGQQLAFDPKILGIK